MFLIIAVAVLIHLSFLALASMLAVAGASRAVTLLLNFDSIDFMQDLALVSMHSDDGNKELIAVSA